VLFRSLIPKASETDQTPFILLAEKILAEKRLDPTADTSSLEAEIDHMVYELYGLTDEEIKIVEESVK
jgi:type II restriction/modification system DNA methylase subunit YeeA